MRKRYSDSRGIWRRTALAGAVAACFAGNTALANPTGPAVTQGQASFATQGNTLTVTNAPGTVINWQGFSIAGSEITRFIQQSQMSAVLNRVVGVNPSAILGTLQSNGRVYLVNPNGITVGPGANIDVAGFLASTLNLSDGDFLSGRMRFTETPGAGSVVNEGAITTATGGMVYLVGRDVQNSGIIRSPQGEILLAAGRSIELVDAQTPEVRVELTAPDNQVLNVGQLIAEGGRIGMYGTLVGHSGVASANTAVMGENGKIVFKAIQDVTLDAGSVTTASGPQGGSVTVQAETGTLLVSGTIEAKGDAGKGGTIQLTGDRVGLIGNAAIDASGLTGGGSVLVGGDFQGSNPGVQNAQRTYVGSGTRIAADAIATGDGGKVIVWADGDTRFDGEISARGGAQSGNGGFVEVSGKENLNFYGRVDVGAPSGLAGTILLDPRDITIVDIGGANNGQVTLTTDENIFFADGGADDFTINDETLEALNGSIVLQAQRNINVNAGLELTNQGAGERVVLQAGRHVIINSPLITNGAAIWLEADSPHSNGYPATAGTSGANGAGAVRINAAVQSFGADVTTTETSGGKITLIAGSNSKGGTNGGGFELNADVNAGAGGIDVTLSTQATGQLSFRIGSEGQAQFTTSDTGKLLSTGQLKIGEGTTAGSDGLGPLGLNDQITIKVDQLAIGATAGGPVTLASTAGTSLVLTSGDGGILVDRPLSTDQSTFITTTGALTINQPLTTNGETLNITAASISGVDFITNTGAITCTGTGCPGTIVIHWDGSESLDWFDPLNWSGNAVPTNQDAVEIHTSLGTILISGAAVAKSLIADVPIAISGTGSLFLFEASQFTRDFSLSGSLLGTGVVAVNGSSGVLTWNGGTMGSGGMFTLGVGSFGTLSATLPLTLTLDRVFHNSGVLTLSGATINGTGSITNAGILTAALGTSNAINVTLSNPSNSLIQALGSLTATLFPTNDGAITVGAGGTFSTNGASLVNSGASSIVVDEGNFSTLGTEVLTDGSGNLSVAGALNAGTVTLLAGGSGGVTLNAGSTVTASGSGDSIVISGASFTNSAGSAALNPGAGRFLVWSTNANPFGGGTPDDRGSLAFDFKQYNATFGSTAVLGTGNGFLYTLAPTITPVLQGTVTKTYDGLTAATLAAGNFKTTGIGEVDGDTVILSNPAAGTYASAHAGSGILVTASSASSLTSATNGAATVFGYQVSGTPASGTVGTIDPRQLTASASITAAPKTYDGLLAASTSTVSGNTSGTVNGDTVALDTSGVSLNYNSVHVASATTISATGSVTLGTITSNPAGTQDGTADNPVAAQAGDYVLAAQPTIASVAGSITAAQLTASASITAAPKTYDGLLVASTSTVSGNVTGLVGTDAMTLDTSGVSLNYNSANVASATTISATGNVALGALTSTGSGTKDGSSAANRAMSLAGDYVLAAQPTIASVAGSITSAPLAVTANSTSKIYGQTVIFNGTEFISSGLQNSETIGTVTLTSAGAAPTAGVAGNPYAITPSLATGGTFSAGNYTITYNNGTLTVSPAVIGLAGMREYDGTMSFAAGTFGSINGVNGETLTLSGSGTVASPKVLAGTQALALGTLALGNGTGVASNYTLAGGAHTGTITASVTFPFVWDLISAVDLNWSNPANWNQGAVPLNGATASIPSGFTGPVVYSSASGATGLTTLSSGSGFMITGGTLTLGNSTADVSTFSGRPLTLNGGTLDGVGTISLVGTTLDVLAGGVLGGSRTIIGDVNNLAGTVSPGASPGTMTIDGNYLQGPSGTLLAEIGGLAAGTQYDQLIVSGTVTLDGNLNVSLGNGFIPATGNTFTIVESGGGVSGIFATTSLPSASSMRVDLLASSVNVTTGTLAPVDTAQLISFQINQIDASLPTETDMSKFIVVTDPITNETFVTVGAVEIAVSGGAKERAQKPGVCR